MTVKRLIEEHRAELKGNAREEMQLARALINTGEQETPHCGAAIKWPGAQMTGLRPQKGHYRISMADKRRNELCAGCGV